MHHRVATYQKLCLKFLPHPYSPRLISPRSSALSKAKLLDFAPPPSNPLLISALTTSLHRPAVMSNLTFNIAVGKFSLIVTFISLLAELALLSTALLLFKYISCRRLSSTGKLSINSHRKTVSSITLLVILLFVATETLVSIYTDLGKIPEITTESCVRAVSAFPNATTELTSSNAEAETLHFRCVNVNDLRITYSAGNFSKVTSSISCDSQPLYSYIIQERKNFTKSGRDKICAGNQCVIAFLEPDKSVLYISRPVRKRKFQRSKNGTILVEFFPTKVQGLNITHADLPVLTRRILRLYVEEITEEGEIRRLGFLSSEETQCDFVSETTDTSIIPTNIVIVTAVLWGMSFFSWIGVLGIRKKIYFDLSDPLHWAVRAVHDEEEAVGTDPLLHTVETLGSSGELDTLRITGYVRP